jgi:hypothetical protein
MGSLDHMVLGHYTLSYGQGLVFYRGLGEFVRPVKHSSSGAALDMTSGRNSYLRGGFLGIRISSAVFEGFFSRQDLGLPLNLSSGTVDGDLNSLRSFSGDIQDEEALQDKNSLTETLVGGHGSWMFSGKSSLGFTGAVTDFDRSVDPVKKDFADAHVFRGNKNRLGAIHFDVHPGGINVFGEVARSWSGGGGLASQKGTAWTFTVLERVRPGALWAGLFSYDAHFFSRHGKGPSFSVLGDPESLTDNQRGLFLGGRYGGGGHTLEIHSAFTHFPEATGNGTDSRPLRPSQARSFRLSESYSPRASLTFHVRYERKNQEVYGKISDTDNRRQGTETVDRVRLEIKKGISSQGISSQGASPQLEGKLRYERREENSPVFSKRVSGDLWMGELRGHPRPSLTVTTRYYIFDSPEAYLTTGVEEIWSGVPYYQFAGSLNSLRGTPGTRFVFMVKQAFGRSLNLWMKYDLNRRPGDLSTGKAGGSRHGFHVQVDCSF